MTALNDGGDNGLHLAASKGNKVIIQRVRQLQFSEILKIKGNHDHGATYKVNNNLKSLA